MGPVQGKWQIDFNYPLAARGINKHNRKIVLALAGGGAIGWVVFLWFWVAWLGGGVETCTSATPRDARQLISNQSAVIAGEENETRS